MKTISSLTHPLVKKIVSLHDKKGRSTYNQFIVEGTRAISTFLQAGWRPEVLLSIDELEQYSELMLTKNMISPENILRVTSAIMDKISTQTTPSGVLALFAIPSEYYQQKNKKKEYELGNSVVFYGLQDPGNLGTLLRTAVALRYNPIVLIDGCDPFSPKVVQASAGALALTTVISLTWQELLTYKNKYLLCALVVSGGQSPEQLDIRKSILVIGNEAWGIPVEQINQCEQKMTLPMPGNTNSLNAAVAGSLGLYIQYQARTSLKK